MNKTVLSVVAATLAAGAAYASSIHARFGVLFSDAPYNEVLQTYVDEQGLVDYEGLKENREGFDRYIIDIMGLYTDEYDAWQDEQQIAFWLNTYNALTLKTVIDVYPIRKNWKAVIYPLGIRHITGAWDKNLHTVKGEKYTLDQIEHEILRKEFNEPRIHMALVCAARGCPLLRREAYTAENLDEQLDDQTRTFLADPEKFQIDHDKKIVHLSSIFKWFGEDFTKKYGDEKSVSWGSEDEQAVMAFLKKYLPKEDWEKFTANEYEVDYLDYDWALNEQS